MAIIMLSLNFSITVYEEEEGKERLNTQVYKCIVGRIIPKLKTVLWFTMAGMLTVLMRSLSGPRDMFGSKM